MSISRDEWLQRHQQACQSQLRPRIEATEFTARPDGGFDVVIRGEDLVVGAIPGSIRVGGRVLKETAVRNRGLIHGMVDDVREGEEVTIDLGGGDRASTRASNIT